MIFGFSSMGEPKAEWSQLQEFAQRFNLDFVELRSLGGTIDLPPYFLEHNIVCPPPPPVRLIGSSLCLTQATEKDIAKFFDYARLAHRLRSPYVRVFGGGHWPQPPETADYVHAAEVTRTCRQFIEEENLAVELLLETHDAFSSSEKCLQLNDRLDCPLNILWDSHHTWRLAGETPSETWAQLGSLVRHIHCRDSTTQSGSPAGYVHALPGTGDYPTQELWKLLRRVQFQGGLSLEWEKFWLPEIADLEEALTAFRTLIDGAVQASHGNGCE